MKNESRRSEAPKKEGDCDQDAPRELEHEQHQNTEDEVNARHRSESLIEPLMESNESECAPCHEGRDGERTVGG